MAKILVADDDLDLLQVLRDILQKGGHKVTTAPNGTVVLDILKKETPDLLLLDVMMPELDGYSLQKELSRDDKLSTLPVIVITALKSTDPLFRQFKQVSAILNKPFEAKKLLDTIDKVLAGQT